MNTTPNQNFPYTPQSPLTRWGRGLAAGLKSIPKRIAARVAGSFRRAADGIRNFFSHFAEGDGITKGSYLLMGLGHIYRGRFVRGVIYLALEALFVLYLLAFGGRYLGMFLENFPAGGSVGRVETTSRTYGIPSAGNISRLQETIPSILFCTAS